MIAHFWRLLRSVLAGVILAATVSGTVTPTPAAAGVVLTLNSTADEPDASPGDGVCASTPSGACTLRAAIMETNALPGADTIVLPASGYQLERTGSGDDTDAFGDLDILDDLTLDGSGPGSALVMRSTDPAGALYQDRIFDIASGPIHVTIRGLLINRGSVPASGGPGGGIRNGGYLTLERTGIWGNFSADGGGGLANFGTAVLAGVSIQGNIANRSVGGAGIYNAGSMTVSRSSITSNDALGSSTSGGGIYNTGALTVVETLVYFNQARRGGGIDNIQGTLTLDRASVLTNSVWNVENRVGAGIANFATLNATNTVIHGNNGDLIGAGLYNEGTATLTNATLYNNTAFARGRTIASPAGMVVLKNSIVQHSRGDNCIGTIVSQGHNIDSGDTCGLTAPGDLSNTDPKLAPPQPLSGYDYVPVLQPGSPAIDAGSDSSCPGVDQRRLPRPRDGNGDGTATCDIGAYELQEPYPATSCSPRPHIQVAVTRGGPDSLIATVTATGTLNGTPNRLHALRFGQVTNATVDVADQTEVGGNQTVTLPDGLSQTAIVVRRGPNGDTATVQVFVVDDCGEWPTLVGGGRDAWSGAPSGPSGIPPSAAPTTPMPAASAGASVPPSSLAPPPTPTACQPRPPIRVNAVADGSGRLRVTLTAGQGGLREVRVGAAQNATVDVGGRTGLGAGATVALSDQSREVSLLVRRVTPGAPATVPLVVVDGCSEWPTVVGGGPDAF